ncbi:diaminopropionate ammonia-lyase [Marinomonas sp.]|nr:diaminopropionate ammonia-lyase [Marinomonas sp.]MDB4837587.1 diaminopropionate ammonia-lyase [Marinomonas sp.]
MLNITGKITHFANPKANATHLLSDEQKDVVSIEKASVAIRDITAWPNYSITPLHSLTSSAESANVAAIWYKDESKRFGLKSFKALGGAYAVARQLQKKLAEMTGTSPTITALLEGHYEKEVAQLVVSCATDGNHGRSVAWGAKMFGCGCVIYIHQDVSIGRMQAMQALGAQVIRITGNYDEAVDQADKDAKEHNRILVSDTSYEGYMEIPKDVVLGYTVMLAEVVEQLDHDIPTHVFIQGGVGGVASAVTGYFWDLWKTQRPKIIVVEPEEANCLQLSAKAGKPTVIEGDLNTLMAGLACGKVSDLAWKILDTGVDDFLTLSEEAIPDTMRYLAKGYKEDPAIEAGESAVPGLAALLIARASAQFSTDLKLDSTSKVLVIGTEGATDPELYQQLISSDKN